MRALVGFVIVGVLTIVACKKNDDGGGAVAAAGPAGYAGTPQSCTTSKYITGLCAPSQQPMQMPSQWRLGTGWSFPTAWEPSQYTCGCPRVTVAYPGQPGFIQEQFGVFFAANSTVACAPVGYFGGAEMRVGNPIALLQQAQMTFGLNVGMNQYGANPYGGSPYANGGGGYRPAYGYGANFGGNYGASNFYRVNNPQAFGQGYGQQQVQIADAGARACLARMIIGCDLALEQRLVTEGQGASQCNGGTCVPAGPTFTGQNPTTVGYCSFQNPNMGM